MFRLIICFFYIAGYLIYSIPKLKKVRNLDPNLPVSERDVVVHSIAKHWARTIMRLTGSKIEVEGEENLPDGPVLFISNHEGDFDIPVLLGYINKPFGFISKIEVKKVPIVASWMEVLNCVFLDRNDRRQSVKAIRSGAELLKSGHSILIFPEGTRSKGGAIADFKSGSFRLARDAKVPIVPISIQGTADAYEKNGRLVRPADIKVKICSPLSAEFVSQSDLNELSHITREIIIAEQTNNHIAS